MANKKKKQKSISKPVKKIVKKTIAKKPTQVAKKPSKKTVKKAATKVAKKTVKLKTKVALNVTKKTPAKKATPQVAAVISKNIDYSKAITPLGDRLVVRLVHSERVTPGGLIIPETASQAEGFLKAEVLAVGSGSKNKKGAIKAMDVKIGDTVLFSQYSGTKVEFNSEELQIIKEIDVMGVIQN